MADATNHVDFENDLILGARNLLLNCAELKQDETVVIVSEDPTLGWYDAELTGVIDQQIRSLGIIPTLLQVGKPNNYKNPTVVDAVDKHDCTIFLARIGDQDRFEEIAPGKKTIMCYTRDTQMLASSYGCADYRAFLDLKLAVNAILQGAKNIRITCRQGTDLSGNVSMNEKEFPNDVSVRRFPLGVPQPINASTFSGRVALTNFLTPTGSKMYDPASIEIEDTVFVDVTNGIISKFSGSAKNIQKIQEHYKMVSKKFDIQEDNVHSFHAGIHPGCAYSSIAALDPDRWANTVFTNPRVLHFHTCGNYSPGEICWMVIDQTLAVDNKNLWHEGRLCVADFDRTRHCIENWPELKAMFENPVQAIGLEK